MANLKNITDGQPSPGRASVEAPPLDYALNDELTISDVELTLDEFDLGIGPMPPPPAVKWVALIAAVLFIVAVWMVL